MISFCQFPAGCPLLRPLPLTSSGTWMLPIINYSSFTQKIHPRKKEKPKHMPLMLHSVYWECFLLSFSLSWWPSENSMWIFCVQNSSDCSWDWQASFSSCTFSKVLFLGSFLLQHRKGSSWDWQCLYYHSETCQSSWRGCLETVSVDFEAQRCIDTKGKSREGAARISELNHNGLWNDFSGTMPSV